MLVNLAVNHKRATLSILDQLTLRDPGQFYKVLMTMDGVTGALILQTCNRVEFYLDSKDETDPSPAIISQWANTTGFRLDHLERLVENETGDDAVRHLVRVGSGLESMLVGEPQILEQLKQALKSSQMEGAASEYISDLFEKSIRAASHVREKTGIGKGTVSLGSAAIRLAEEEIGPVKNSTVLLVGTGQVGTLLMKALNARKVERIIVAGRNFQQTVAFCQNHGGKPIQLDQIQESLNSIDLVILATGATTPIVTRDFLQGRNRRKLVLLDLSTPRNVSVDVEEMDGVIVRTLDNMRGIAEETWARRRDIVKHADPLAEQYALNVISLLRRENIEPIVAEMYHRADLVRAKEVEKAISRLHLNSEEKEVLEKMSISLVEKILGPPAGNLRKAAETGDKQVLTVAGQIFKND